jgi:hypothetical protein
METEGFMTASDFAKKINTPYPTVAAWLREGRIPGAELQQFGSVKFWMVPVDVLKDFERPKKGRPRKVGAVKTKASKAVKTKISKVSKQSANRAKKARKAKTAE